MTVRHSKQEFRIGDGKYESNEIELLVPRVELGQKIVEKLLAIPWRMHGKMLILSSRDEDRKGDAQKP